MIKLYYPCLDSSRLRRPCVTSRPNFFFFYNCGTNGIESIYSIVKQQNGQSRCAPSRACGGSGLRRRAADHSPSHAHHVAEKFPRRAALSLDPLALRPSVDLPQGPEGSRIALLPPPRPPHAERMRLLHQRDGAHRLLRPCGRLPARVSLQRPSARHLSAAGRLSVEEDRGAPIEEGGCPSAAHRLRERGDLETVSAERVLQVREVQVSSRKEQKGGRKNLFFLTTFSHFCLLPLPPLL